MQLTDTIPGNAAMRTLGADLDGVAIAPGDADYDRARAVWNATIDRRPAVIARCRSVSDVRTALRFAREHDLPIAVRGGGHNVAGNAVCDSGLMIDLSPMKGIRIDPVRRTARAEAGCTWRDLDHECQAFGLATTGGVIPTTGIAGLTLGGGIGWLMGKHGLSCDNLLSVDLVTADGRLVTATVEDNADLFWGVRGGGGNFGIATSFEYRLHPIDQVLGGMVVHPIGKAREVLQFYRDFALAAPDELGTMAALLTSPEGEKILALLVCYCGSLTDGERILRPLRVFGPPLADQMGPMPYTQLQALLEAGFPPGMQNYWKSDFLRALDDAAIDTIVGNFERVPSPTSAVAIEAFGGAMSRVPDDATAFNHRHTPFNLLIVGIWPDPSDNTAHMRWVREFWDAMQPFSSGAVYVNYLGPESDEGAGRIKAAYGSAKYEKLVMLKNKYDPTNLFRLNQNIKPTA
jgi:FAD/FMN-containing dehydrogenase